MTTTLYYDLCGQLLSEAYSGGPLSGFRVTNVFDQFMRRTNLSVFNGVNLISSTAYAYDNASRLRTVSDGNGNTAGYSYVANSSLVGQIGFTNSGGLRMTTTKTWDFLNRMTSISSVPSASSVVNFGYSYNSANERIRSALADASYWRYDYDGLGQVISGHKYWSDQTPVGGQNFDYAFDTIGNRTQTKAGGDQHGWNQRNANYYANNLNQYTNRDVPGALDIIGVAFATNSVSINNQTPYRKGEYFWEQLTTNNSGSAFWVPVTVASPNQPSVTGHSFVPQTPESFGYDSDGNLSSDGRWNYTWDGENRLIQMTANTSVGPQLQLSFTYDWQGRRIQKIVATNGPAGYVGEYTNNFIYDGWNLVAEVSPNGSLVRSYVWGSDLSGSIQGAGGVGGLLEMSYCGSPTTNCFAAYDGNGNLAALINAANGQICAAYEYGPFGEVIRTTGPMAKANLLRFSTKYQDDESDLVYYGYRYCNTTAGRWVGRDPVLEPATDYFMSRSQSQPIVPLWKTSVLDLEYAFVGNDAFDRIDLLGMCDTGPEGTCGADVTRRLKDTQIDVWKRFNNLTFWKKQANCQPWRQYAGINPALLPRAISGWSIFGITIKWQDACANRGCGQGAGCEYTVHLRPGCYYGWDVNYVSFGWIFNLCNISRAQMDAEVLIWKLIPHRGGDTYQSLVFANAGFDGWPVAAFPRIPRPPTNYQGCSNCGFSAGRGPLGSYWPHSDWNYIWY